MTIFRTHLAYLSARGLTAEDATAAGIRSLDPVAAAAIINGPGSPGLAGDVLEIPFFDAEGNRLLGRDGAEFSRVRIFGGSKIRFMSRPKAGEHLYVPPQLGTVARSEVEYLVVCEQEIGALCATLHGIPAVGLSGATMGYDPRRDKTSAAESRPVNPALLSLAKSFGGVVVVADSDASTKSHVRAPLTRLAKDIADQAGVPVAFAIVPGASSKTKKPAKTKDPLADVAGDIETEEAKLGLDDWLVKQRGDVTPIQRFLNKAFADEMERLEMTKTGGYIALGYGESNSLYVWSPIKEAIDKLTPSTMSTVIGLAGTVGPDWLPATYPGEKPGTVDVAACVRDIQRECIAKGRYNPRQERGVGVWVDGDGALLVNGEQIFRPDGMPISRVHGRHVYVKAEGDALPLTPETVPAPKEVARQVQDVMQAFNLGRGITDAVLLTGLVALSPLAGALTWRPHFGITGARMTGKSSLQKILRALMLEDQYAIGATLSSKTTAAGLRQHLGNSAVPLLLDEAEPNASASLEAVEMARIASSGDKVLQGTADGQGRQYTVRTIVVLSAITLPNFKAADETRFFITRLNPLTKENKPHALTKNSCSALREMAPSLMMRMVQSWDRYRGACKIVRERLEQTGCSERFRDNAGAVLAAYLVFTNDGEISEVLVDDLLSHIDLTDDQQRQTESKDEEEMLHHILSFEGRAMLDGKLTPLTVAQMAAFAMNETARGHVTRALGTIGLRVMEYVKEDGFTTSAGEPAQGWYLLINPSSDGFRKLMRGSDWKSGRVVDTLRRKEGAFKYDDNRRISIGGVTSAPLAVPIDIKPEKRPASLADLSVGFEIAEENVR